MSKLAKACELSFNDWIATFPEIMPEPEYSKKHEKWKKKLFDKMRGDRYHTFTTRTVKVMLVAAILSVLLLTAFVIPSSREFILDNLDEFSRYELTDNNKNSVNGEITVGYIPDGFELDNTEYFSKYVTSKYKSQNGNFFTIFKYSSAAKVDFNTENSISEEIIIDGIKYVYCEGDLGVNNLIWTRNDYVYRISGQLSYNELLKISENVE